MLSQHKWLLDFLNSCSVYGDIHRLLILLLIQDILPVYLNLYYAFYCSNQIMKLVFDIFLTKLVRFSLLLITVIIDTH